MTRAETFAFLYLILGWAPAAVVVGVLRATGWRVASLRLGAAGMGLAAAVYVAALETSGGPTLVGVGGLGFLVATIALAAWCVTTWAVLRRHGVAAQSAAALERSGLIR